MPKIVIVIPCYNEEKRLDSRRLAELFECEGVHVLLVNDGSRDRTKEVIEAFVNENPGRATASHLIRNSGKAEAVRQGLLSGLALGASHVGYLDADLATPPREMLHIVEEGLRTAAQVTMGSRILLLGRHVERNPARHYLGRVFATGASFALGMRVYDTQCGAKVLKDSPALRFALAKPFRSRWAFDVELLGRLLLCVEQPLSREDFLEVPLHEWRDQAGSKLTAKAMLRAGVDLVEIGLSRRAQVLWRRK